MWHLMALSLLVGLLPIAGGDGFLPPLTLSDASETETSTTSSATTTTSTSTSNEAVHLRDLVHPERLQPWWLLVLSNNAFFVMQKMAFGFDLKFSKPGCFSKYWAPFRPLVSLGLAFMALCAWRSDLIMICNLPSEISTSQKVLLLIVIYVLSPNFRAAKSFFMGLRTQSPIALLNPAPPLPESFCDGVRTSLANAFKSRSSAGPLAARYAFIPLLDVPLLPWSACWFPWHKWIYMCVLLPYELPATIVAWILSASYCWPGTGCALCIQIWSSCGHFCCCCWWLFLVIITLGLWHTANQDFSAEWHLIYPYLEASGIQILAYLVPILVIRVYTHFLHWQSLDVYLPELDSRLITLEALREVCWKPEIVEAGRQKLLQLQKEVQGEKMALDFGPNWIEGLETEESSEEKAHGRRAIGLEGLKVRIVSETLLEMMHIPILQLVFILLAYFYNSPMDFESYTKAMKDTLDERSVAQYSQNVLEKISSETTEFSIKAAIVWNLL